MLPTSILSVPVFEMEAVKMASKECKNIVKHLMSIGGTFSFKKEKVPPNPFQKKIMYIRIVPSE